MNVSSLPVRTPLLLILAGDLAILAAQHMTTEIDISRRDLGLAPDGFTFWRMGDGEVGDWRGAW